MERLEPKDLKVGQPQPQRYRAWRTADRSSVAWWGPGAPSPYLCVQTKRCQEKHGSQHSPVQLQQRETAGSVVVALRTLVDVEDGRTGGEVRSGVARRHP